MHGLGLGAYAANECPYPTFKNIGSPPYEHSFNRAYALTIRTVPALIGYYHFILGAPPIKPWLAGIGRGWLASWPGLAAERARKHCSKKAQATYGHMQKRRQHAGSTKADEGYEYVPPKGGDDKLAEEDRDAIKRSKRHHAECRLADGLASMAAMGIAGRAPATSSGGREYIFAMKGQGSSSIFYEPMKPRKPENIAEAFKKCYARLAGRGFTAKLRIAQCQSFSGNLASASILLSRRSW